MGKTSHKGLLFPLIEWEQESIFRRVSTRWKDAHLFSIVKSMRMGSPPYECAPLAPQGLKRYNAWGQIHRGQGIEPHNVEARQVVNIQHRDSSRIARKVVNFVSY